MNILETDYFPDGHKAGFVAIVGAPNAGKSTLMNRFLQQKIAIVSPKPQTTRTTQLGIVTTDAYQIIFVDTPGLIAKAQHLLDETMVETVQDTIRNADVVLWLVDGTTRPNEADRTLAALLKPLAKRMPVIVAFNKVDSARARQEIRFAYAELLPEVKFESISAETGLGVELLIEDLVEVLPESPRLYPEDQITDLFVRQIAAEMIREQLLLQLREEIPHSAAVTIDEYKEREDGTTYIRANIIVDRETHKPIVIGRKGSQIKKIGMAAREQIAHLIDGKVFLELFVKVEPKWRRNEQMLQRFGYAG